MGEAFGLRWFWYAVLAVLGVTVAVLAVLSAVVQVRQAAAAEANAASYRAPTISVTSAAAASSVTFAVVGDSVTAADSPDIDHGRPGPGSWVSYAAGASDQFVGGWALGGTTTTTMAQNVTPYTASVLVIMAGTNDVGQNVPFSTTTTNLQAIVKKAGVSKVIISAIAPSDASSDAVTRFNTQLRALAGQQQWVFVDPMGKVRTASNQYRSGLSTDGVHPTQDAAKLIGAAIAPIIIDTAG